MPDDKDKKSALEQYSWSLGHLYPDQFEPDRIPDQLQFPTHVFKTSFQRTIVIPSTKDFACYFSPATDCNYQYRNNGTDQPYQNLNFSLSDSALVSYADSDGHATNLGGETITVDDEIIAKSVFVGPTSTSPAQRIFNKTKAWNYSWQGSDTLQHFKKIRLLGAFLKITYTGKHEDLSGIVHVGMGIKGFLSELKSEGLNFNEMMHLPEYRSMTLDAPLFCRYRLTSDELTEFGPYSPYNTIPYFIVYGVGLQEGSSIFIEVEQHFEGVIVSSFEELVNPKKAGKTQLPKADQQEFIKEHADGGTGDSNPIS